MKKAYWYQPQEGDTPNDSDQLLICEHRFILEPLTIQVSMVQRFIIVGAHEAPIEVSENSSTTSDERTHL